MTRSGRDASRIALAAIGAVALVGVIWYTASLRTRNATLREQIARYESGAVAHQVPAAPAAKSRSGSGVARPIDSRPQRMLSEEQRQALRSELGVEPGNKVWFATQANDPEAESFQRELEMVFLESGWELGDSSEAAYRVKPGLFMFMAETAPSAHVTTAMRGLQNAGLQVFGGTGYRAYYEKRKEKDPSFVGHELEPGQEFVIVVGPNPDSGV